MLTIALVATGATQINTALAESSPVSGKDMLDQAVALYEKLSDEKVLISEHLSQYPVEDYMLKSVVLGYINLDEVQSPSLIEYARKQDVMNLLYKTVINYDDSYTLSEKDAEIILNECYDNSYIDEENKIAYAFMMKYGIITSNINTEPNKILTWDSCRILVDIIYDYFIQDVTFLQGDTQIVMGSNLSTLPDIYLEPDKIDISEYGFEWYIYNSDADNFCMIGVENERICGFFTNSKQFSLNGIISKGDDISHAQELITSQNLQLFADADNKVDAVLYTSRENGHYEDIEHTNARAIHLLDIINAKREQNGENPYTYSSLLSNSLWATSLETIESMEETDTSLYGCNIFHIYEKLLKSNNNIMFASSNSDMAIGIDTTLNNDTLYVSFVVDSPQNNNEYDFSTSDVVEFTQENPNTILPSAYADDKAFYGQTIDTKNPEPPEITTPDNTAFVAGDDIVINIEKPVSSKYHLEVYDLEKGIQTVNSYITTSDDSISILSDVLENGIEYKITLSSVSESGDKTASDSVNVFYGDATKTGVDITLEDYSTDNDYIPLVWESSQYTDFYVDVYNSNGDLVVSSIVEDEKNAMIQGLDPDTYYVYVTALRKGTTIEKAQDKLQVEITFPEPVINEYILENDDTYYFQYEDESLGILYFYDEEIIDVEDGGKTTKKKKIIQKQVKNIKAYRTLSKYQLKPEYTTGEPISYGAYTQTGNAIVSEAKKYLGVPYIWGGTTPDGFDCSGLVQYVCRSLGINVDRVTHDQAENGYKVERENLAPGDLVFFKNDNGYIHHVGIYVGNNQFIHAPQRGDVVKISNLDGNYLKNYYEARRVY